MLNNLTVVIRVHRNSPFNGFENGCVRRARFSRSTLFYRQPWLGLLVLLNGLLSGLDDWRERYVVIQELGRRRLLLFILLLSSIWHRRYDHSIVLILLVLVNVWRGQDVIPPSTIVERFTVGKKLSMIVVLLRISFNATVLLWYSALRLLSDDVRLLRDTW